MTNRKPRGDHQHHEALGARRSAQEGLPSIDKLAEVEAGWRNERPDLELGLIGLLWRIEKAHYFHERRMEGFARSAGLLVGDLLVLLTLRRTGKPYALRPTDLFRRLLVTSGAMTKRVDRLVKLGMVKRVAADDDRRSELARLTPRGFAVTETAISRIATGLAAIQKASGLSGKELAELDHYMRRLVEHMEGVTELIVSRQKPR